MGQQGGYGQNMYGGGGGLPMDMISQLMGMPVSQPMEIGKVMGMMGGNTGLDGGLTLQALEGMGFGSSKDEHVDEITVDDFFDAIIESLDNDKDVFEYNKEINSDSWFGKQSFGGLVDGFNFIDPTKFLNQIYGSQFGLSNAQAMYGMQYGISQDKFTTPKHQNVMTGFRSTNPYGQHPPYGGPHSPYSHGPPAPPSYAPPAYDPYGTPPPPAYDPYGPPPPPAYDPYAPPTQPPVYTEAPPPSYPEEPVTEHPEQPPPHYPEQPPPHYPEQPPPPYPEQPPAYQPYPEQPVPYQQEQPYYGYAPYEQASYGAPPSYPEPPHSYGAPPAYPTQPPSYAPSAPSYGNYPWSGGHYTTQSPYGSYSSYGQPAYPAPPAPYQQPPPAYPAQPSPPPELLVDEIPVEPTK